MIFLVYDDFYEMDLIHLNRLLNLRFYFLFVILISVFMYLLFYKGLMIGFFINKFGCSAVILAGGFLQGLAILVSVFGNHAVFLFFTIGVLLGEYQVNSWNTLYKKKGSFNIKIWKFSMVIIIIVVVIY